MQDWHQLTDFEILAEIGSRFKMLRMSKNLTQKDLAEKSGLNRSTIRELENGKPLNVLSLISVFRCLEILPKLEDLLQSTENSPVLAINQAHRMRVKRSRKNKTTL